MRRNCYRFVEPTSSNGGTAFVSPPVVLQIRASTARHEMFFLSLHIKELKGIVWGVDLRRTGS